MKKLLFISLLFLIPALGFSQTKKSIDSFLDIPFGSDSATVKTAMAAKGAIKVDSLSKTGKLAYTGFSMSGRKVLRLTVNFVGNKAFEAYFVFSDFDDSDALNYYNSFSTDITSVYGKGDMTNNFGTENNLFRIKKLELGNASCQTLWQSKNKNRITLTFDSFNRSILIVLDYQDAILRGQYDAKRRADL